jgi:hypothetical protein
MTRATRVPPVATMNLSRRRFLAAGVCASSGLGPKVARAQEGIWQELRREDAGFRIELPGTPRIRVQRGRPDNNWITSSGALVRYQHEIFDVTWAEFKDTVAVEDEYTRFRDMMAGAGYQIEEDIPLTLNDVPAREFVIETGTMGARNIQYSPTVRRFLDSFQLLRP